MKVKITPFHSKLRHSEDFESETARFLGDIQARLGFAFEFSPIDDYDCDVKLLFVQTGGSEGFFLKNADKLREPYYILTNGANNSLAASLEIMTYLNLNGKKGEILHGSAEYIADRIRDIASASSVIKKLKNTRLGVIGKPSDWLIASVPDYGDALKKLGVTLVDVPLSEAEEGAKRAEGASVTGYQPFDEGELKKAAAIRDALFEIVKKYRLDGLTVRCFDLLTSLKSTGCLALAELNAHNITAACEGDVSAMLSMYIASQVGKSSCFQANPSRMDVEKNSVVFAHCTVPFDMLDGYTFDTHFESGTGVAVRGKMREGAVTVFRLSKNLKDYFVSSGRIIKNLNESNLCRTQIEVILDKPVTELLTSPCGNHHVIFYGDYAKSIERVMKELIYASI